jgi:hypothetical protein
MALENLFRGDESVLARRNRYSMRLSNGSLLGPEDLGGKRTTNLPMMSEGINQAAESPPVFLPNRDDL